VPTHDDVEVKQSAFRARQDGSPLMDPTSSEPTSVTDVVTTSREPFTIALFGDVDLVRKSELLELTSEFRRSGARDLDVDLGGVEFMDSTGIGALFRLRRLADERGGSMRLLAPQRPVRRALDVAGLSELVTIEST
jgi:anti-anti-sigma factor